MCIAAKDVPIQVERKRCHLVDRIPALEQPRCSLVTEIVEAEILNSEYSASAGEPCSNGLGVVREDQFTGSRLAFDDLERLGRELAFKVIPFLGARVLHVPHYNHKILLNQVVPPKPGDLGLSA